MRSGDHLGDAKMSNKGTSLRRVNFLTNHNRRKRFLLNEEEGQIYKILLQNFLFLPGDLVMIRVF